MTGFIVFGGSSHPHLLDLVCQRLGTSPGRVTCSKFSNNETRVEIGESVRDQDVYIIQSGCGDVNNMFMELLIMVQACQTASARKVTAVIPCFPYARQSDVPHRTTGAPLTSVPLTVPGTPSSVDMEREDVSEFSHRLTGLGPPTPLLMHRFGSSETGQGGYRQWVARSGRLIADLLTCAGADHVMTLDLHDAQFQGFFDCGVDNLHAQPLFIKWIKGHVPDWKEAVIVSPDAGGAKRATAIADRLQLDFALIHKERRSSYHPHKPEMMLVGQVQSKTCILIDDIADTCFTITKAARVLSEHGATQIYALITHGIFSGDALERIERSKLDVVCVSNSVPQAHHLQQCHKLQTLDVSHLFAEAIRRTHHGESVSVLFEP